LTGKEPISARKPEFSGLQPPFGEWIARDDACADDTRRARIFLELCLPTAPVLPNGENGDFGTSPLCGQLSTKPELVLCM
jgi:hypothetical protein